MTNAGGTVISVPPALLPEPVARIGPQTGMFQISFAYWRMVRSEENQPMRAVRSPFALVKSSLLWIVTSAVLPP